MIDSNTIKALMEDIASMLESKIGFLQRQDRERKSMSRIEWDLPLSGLVSSETMDKLEGWIGRIYSSGTLRDARMRFELQIKPASVNRGCLLCFNGNLHCKGLHRGRCVDVELNRFEIVQRLFLSNLKDISAATDSLLESTVQLHQDSLEERIRYFSCVSAAYGCRYRFLADTEVAETEAEDNNDNGDF